MVQNKHNITFLILWLIIMAAGIILMFTGIANESLWYDESYSGAIVNHSFSDIITITGGDNHPPLYYLMLRVFVFIFGNTVFTLRTFSVLGAAALASLGIGPVRRALGNRFGLIYTGMTFALPIIFSMAQEARMYTWAAFFVTGSALFGYLAQKEDHLKDWIFFGVCTFCAAYTHYYSLLAAAVICMLLFVVMLIGKKKILPFVCAAGAVALGYVPWLFNLISQANKVVADYWIPPVGNEVIQNMLIYPFSNKFSWIITHNIAYTALYVSAALILFGIIYSIVRKDKNVKLVILAVGTYVLTIGAGILASVIIRPVLVERYIVTVMGLFVLALSYGIGSLGKRILPVLGCAVILALSIPQTLFTASNRFNGPMREAVEYLEPQMQPEDVFLHTDEHTLGTFCYYFPDSMHYFFQREGYRGYSNYDAFKPNGTEIGSVDEIGSSRIWLVQRFGASDNISARQWFQDKELIRDSENRPFRIITSWYGFDIARVTAGNNGG